MTASFLTACFLIACFLPLFPHHPFPPPSTAISLLLPNPFHLPTLPLPISQLLPLLRSRPLYLFPSRVAVFKGGPPLPKMTPSSTSNKRKAADALADELFPDEMDDLPSGVASVKMEPIDNVIAATSPPPSPAAVAQDGQTSVPTSAIRSTATQTTPKKARKTAAPKTPTTPVKMEVTEDVNSTPAAEAETSTSTAVQRTPKKPRKATAPRSPKTPVKKVTGDASTSTPPASKTEAAPPASVSTPLHCSPCLASFPVLTRIPTNAHLEVTGLESGSLQRPQLCHSQSGSRSRKHPQSLPPAFDLHSLPTTDHLLLLFRRPLSCTMQALALLLGVSKVAFSSK